MNKTLAIWQQLDEAYSAHAPMPTARELCQACGLSSTSVVTHHLGVLEREGIIKRMPGKARGITLERRYGE